MYTWSINCMGENSLDCVQTSLEHQIWFDHEALHSHFRRCTSWLLPCCQLSRTEGENISEIHCRRRNMQHFDKYFDSRNANAGWQELLVFSTQTGQNPMLRVLWPNRNSSMSVCLGISAFQHFSASVLQYLVSNHDTSSTFVLSALGRII